MLDVKEEKILIDNPHFKAIDRELKRAGFILEENCTLYLQYHDKGFNRRFTIGNGIIIFSWKKDKHKEFTESNLDMRFFYIEDGKYWKTFKENCFEFFVNNYYAMF